MFASSWCNDTTHAERTVILQKETIWGLSERLNYVKLVIDVYLILSCQFFTSIRKTTEKALSAPMVLHNTVVFPHSSLTNCKFIWFNATLAEINLDRIGGKVLQACLNDVRISENKFDPERTRPHHAGSRKKIQYFNVNGNNYSI